jgi:hypothetical protein
MPLTPGRSELEDRFFDLVLVVVADRGDEPPHELPYRLAAASFYLFGTCTAHVTWPPPSA